MAREPSPASAAPFDAGPLKVGFDAEQRAQTLRTGRVTAALILTIVPIFVWFDFAVLQVTTLWPLRLLPIGAAVIFGVASIRYLPRRPSLTIPLHASQVTALMLMAVGIALVVFYQRPPTADFRAGATSMLLDVILIVFVLAAGVRPWLPIILFGLLGLLYAGLLAIGTLSIREWGLFGDPLVASLIAVVAARLQERISRREFSARVRAEAAQDAAEEHLAATERLNELLGQEVIERRAVEARLVREIEEHRETAARLERSNLDLQQFAYSVSHDLKEPLRSVVSFQKLVKRRLRELDVSDAEVAELMGYADSGAERLGRLIDDMLAYARVDARGSELVPVELDDVLAVALQSLSAAIQSCAATIRCERLPCVKGDRRQLEQLFQNLLSNAIKFHKPDVAPSVVVEANVERGLARVSVADNGIGIDPVYFTRVFEVFQRLHGHSSYEGSGIGLALCKRIVERHGGQIGVLSAEGEGATFWVSLPVAPGPVPGRESSASG